MPASDDLKAEIAVLGVKLDGIQTLLETKLDHLDDKIETASKHADHKFADHDRDLADLTKRMTTVENNGAHFRGRDRIIWGIVNVVGSALIIMLIEWVMSHH